jgi:RNA-directed DNA polymerase
MTFNHFQISEKILYESYKKCSRGKGNSYNTISFQTDLFNNIRNLSESLINKTYKPSRSICFYFEKPKLREVIAAHFKDRIVHRLLVESLESIYEKSFISDSYACRKGKGTYACVERYREFIKSGTQNGKAPLYYIQMDIKGYFFNIDKEILLNILKKKVKNEELTFLLDTVIRHDPTIGAIFRGKIPKPNTLPPHKTLFHENKQKGLPIGNLTCQFFANLYLNEMDQFIKRNLGIKKYLRYMDDFVVISDSKEELILWKKKIIQFLREKLELDLKDSSVVPISVYKGIDFLGYYIKPSHTLVRHRVVKNLNKKVYEFLEICKENSKLSLHPVLPKESNAIQNSLNSYLGHLKKANSFRLLHKQKEKLLFLYPHLEFQKWKILMNPKKLNRFRNIFSQIQEFSKLLGSTPFLFQIGKYYQLIGFSKEIYKQETFQKFILRYGKVRRFGNVCYEGFRIQLLLKFISCLKSGKINVVHEKIGIFEFVRQREICISTSIGS